MPIDDSEMRQLINHIDGAPVRVMRAAEAAAKRGMQNIKNDLVEEMKSSTHFKAVAPTISYDERATRRGLEYEIGPDKEHHVRGGRPGALANIAYFGGANGGGKSVDFDGPIERELPKLAKHLREALGDAL